MKKQKIISVKQVIVAVMLVLGMTCLNINEAKAAVTTVDDIVYITDDGTKTARVNNIKVIKETMILPDTITDAGITYTINKFDNAHFKDNTTLKTVKLPNEMTSFVAQMFYGCTNLESVTLPSKLTYLGNIAFADCTSLTNIDIPDSVIWIGTSAFNGSGLTEIEIPSGVDTIENYAFKNCKNLTSIKLPNSLSEVKESVFMGCSSLTEIELPTGVNKIGISAFEGCSNLTSIEIPKNVTAINSYAFRNCSKLRTIVIPPNVTASNFDSGDGSAENGMFYGTSKLETVYYPAALKDEMPNAVTSNTGTSQISYVVNTNNTVSLTLDVLGTNVDNIVLPETIYGMPISSADKKGKDVTFICSKHYNESGYNKDENRHWLGTCEVCGEIENELHAFKDGNTACECGYIPFEIVSHPIEGALTYGYSGGTQLTVGVNKTLGNENITYQWQENGKDISGATTNPYNVPIGKQAGKYTYRCKVTCGGYSIFSNAVVVNIGKASNPKVKPEGSMTVPYTIAKVGSVTLPTGWVWDEADKEKKLVPNSAVTATAVYKGADKANYENVSINVTITRKACSHEWDNGVITQKVTTKKKGVKTYTCKICKETKEEKISAPVKGKKYADDQNKAIYSVTKAGLTGGTVTYIKPTSKKASVTIPATVKINGIVYKITSIEKNAFKNNKKITSVTIGKNIKNIGANAFSGCSKLKTVKMGASVTTIGDKAFYKCTALTKITIPAKVKKIGKSAFEGCKKLKNITIKTSKLSTAKVGKNAFKGIKSTATIKVPKAKFKIYRAMLMKKGVGAKVKIKK